MDGRLITRIAGGRRCVVAGIGIRADDDRWSILLWGRNLFDKQYAVGVGAAGTVSPFVKVLGDPRTYGITLRGRF